MRTLDLVAKVEQGVVCRSHEYHPVLLHTSRELARLRQVPPSREHVSCIGFFGDANEFVCIHEHVGVIRANDLMDCRKVLVVGCLGVGIHDTNDPDICSVAHAEAELPCRQSIVGNQYSQHGELCVIVDTTRGKCVKLV